MTSPDNLVRVENGNNSQHTPEVKVSLCRHSGNERRAVASMRQTEALASVIFL